MTTTEALEIVRAGLHARSVEERTWQHVYRNRRSRHAESRRHLRWLLAWSAVEDRGCGPWSPDHWAHADLLAVCILRNAGMLRARRTACP